MSALLGVAGAVSSVNYALGGREKVVHQLARMGTNLLIVTPAQGRSIADRARTGSLVTTLTEADYAAIRREVPLFARSSAFAGLSLLVKAGDLAKRDSPVIGIEPEYLTIKGWQTREGEPFTAMDVRRSGRVALLGSKITRELFNDASPVGERILINRVPFEIAGVMTERGQSLDAANEDDQIYVPLSTAMHRLSNRASYTGILLEAGDWKEMDRAAESVRKVLRERHRAPGKADDFQVLSQKQLVDAESATSAQTLFFVRWIGLSALTVSGLGVLAIGWIGVRERTREIGTRRALGATRTDIFTQILAEAFALGICGAAVGGALAFEATVWLSKWADQPIVFDAASARIAMGFSVMLNLLFAVIPARTAARFDPIQALRFE